MDTPQQLSVSSAQLFDRIRHKRAAMAWLLGNRCDQAASARLNKHRQTIAGWRKAEQWEIWADAKELEMAADAELEALISHAELSQIASEARLAASIAIQKISAGLEENMTDAMGMGAATQLLNTAMSISDKLHGHSAKHARKIDMTVKDATDPAAEKAELIAKYGLVDRTATA